MKQKLPIVLFLFLSFAQAQTPPMDVREKERIIKKLLFAQPDSARVHLKQILNYKGRLHDTVYANANLCYGYTHVLKSSPDSAFYYYDKALLYAKKYPRFYSLITRNKAGAMRKIANYDESFRLLAIAEKKSDSLHDYPALATIYGEMASNYNLMLKSDDAIRYLMKALKMLENSKDKSRITPIKQSLANSYMNIGNYKFALDLYKEVLPAFKAETMSKNYSLTLINYGDCLLNLKRYGAAKKIMLEAIRGLEKFNDQEMVALSLSKLGHIEAGMKNDAKAEKHFKDAYLKSKANKSVQLMRMAVQYLIALNKAKKYDEAQAVINAVEKSNAKETANLADKVSFEEQKTQTYQNIDDQEKALAALKNKMHLMDTLHKNNDEIATMQIQQEFQSKYQGRKAEKLKHKNATLQKEISENKKTNLIPIASLSTIFASLFVLFIVRNRKHRRKLDAAKTDAGEILQQYEMDRKLNEEHRKDIDSKHGELVSNKIALASLESDMNRLVQMLNENPHGIDPELIKQDLHSLVSEKDYRDLFRKKFSEFNSGFQEKLSGKFPQLKKNDLFFCTLLKMNLPYKDIALLMQISHESIIKRKYRVKMKMEIVTEQEFENILQGIANTN